MAFHGVAAGVAAGAAVGYGLWSLSRSLKNAGSNVERVGDTGLKLGGDSIASGFQDAGAAFGRDVRSGVKDIGCVLLFFSLIRLLCNCG